MRCTAKEGAAEKRTSAATAAATRRTANGTAVLACLGDHRACLGHKYLPCCDGKYADLRAHGGPLSHDFSECRRLEVCHLPRGGRGHDDGCCEFPLRRALSGDGRAHIRSTG